MKVTDQFRTGPLESRTQDVSDVRFHRPGDNSGLNQLLDAEVGKGANGCVRMNPP